MITNVEYSVLPGFPGNSEPHFRYAAQSGFSGLKADMRLSSDGVIFLCHDAGYTFDENGKITAFDRDNAVLIQDMPSEEISLLEFAGTGDTAVHPCRLETVLGICKEYDIIPYLTLRPEERREETAGKMYDAVSAAGLTEKLIVNLYSADPLSRKILAAIDPSVKVCNTRKPRHEFDASVIEESAAEKYSVICMNQKAVPSVTPELLKLAAEKGIELWAWGFSPDPAAAEEQCLEDLRAGISGFQTYSRVLTPEKMEALLLK